MNANTFDSHSVSCPICNRTGRMNPGQMFGGLYSCPYCQARLVISWSGHYVRDPFTLKQLAVGRLLRRQSRPLARLLRDVGLGAKRPSVLAVLAGVVVAGVTFAALEGWIPQRNSFPDLVERVSEVFDSTQGSQ